MRLLILLLLLLLVVISKAFLCVKTFTKSVLTWTRAYYHNICCRVVLSEMVLIGLLIILILLIRLCFH